MTRRAAAVDRKGKPRGTAADVAESPPGEAPDDEGTDDGDDVGQVLAQLDGDGRLQVERIAPAHASGWLEDLSVRSGQEANVLGLIRQHFGGGTYRLRAKRKKANGKLVFTRGSALVEIAGEPTFRGKRYNPDGSFLEDKPPPPPAAPAPVVMPQPANQVELLSALAQILQGQQTPGQPLKDVPALVQALAQTAQPAVPDPYQGLERALSLLAKFRAVVGDGDGGGGSEPWDSSGGIGNEGQLLALLMSQQQQQPQPQWNGHTWVWPQPPPWATQPPPQWRQPPQQQPPQQQPPQQPPQASTSAEADDDDEPYSVQDVLEAVGGLDDQQKMEFLAGLGDHLPASVASQIEAHMRERGAPDA